MRRPRARGSGGFLVAGSAMRHRLLTPPRPGVLSPRARRAMAKGEVTRGRLWRGFGGGAPIGSWAGVAAAGALLLGACPAGANPLDGKRYSVDVFQGPILAPSDVIGIGGAYAG